MPDASAVQQLLARVHGDWSVFAELAAFSESDRRDLLRFHRERSVVDRGQIQLRDRLDEALDRLTLVELGVQVGVLTERDAAYDEIPGLRDLFSSAAFVRYTDNYLSLGLRFVAERLRVDLPPLGGTINELPVPRPCPPPVDADRCRSSAAVSRFLSIEPITADPHIRAALRFLDDFSLHDLPRGASIEGTQEPAYDAQSDASDRVRFELWVRGLSDLPDDYQPFVAIADGLVKFAAIKTAFYLDLERDQLRYLAAGRPSGAGLAMVEHDEGRITTWRTADDTRGAFLASNPITARFGLYDLYWFARLLRAEVSPAGTVSYTNGSWLELLRERLLRQERVVEAGTLKAYEDLVRVVLDYTCDLVQNAVDIVSAHIDALTRSVDPAPPATTWTWRRVFDEELEEIARHRVERLGVSERRWVAGQMSTAVPPGTTPPASSGTPGDTDRPRPDGPGRVGWSRHIRTGEHLRELVGLAISGGGIRSATFALGILQRLQELDLLRKVDYLSTVSGGGYIGSWLVGNVHRNRYWLTQPTEWNDSISHLRRYSNYLAPRTGLLSADTWTMWGSWIRNTVLIQMSAVAWLGGLLAVALSVALVFDRFHVPPASPAFTLPGLFGQATRLSYPSPLGLLICIGLVVVTVLLDRNLKNERASRSDTVIQRQIVAPALVGGLIASKALWEGRVIGAATFGETLQNSVWLWWAPVGVLFASYLWLALRSIEELPILKRWRLSFLAALGATVATYVVTCAVFWSYRNWGVDNDTAAWCAFAFGPSMMLGAATAGVMVMIGIIGLDSPDWRREWWTRLGSWLGMYAAGSLVVGIVAIFGPWLLLRGFSTATGLGWKTWSAALGWVATVVGGLLAGNSQRSDGDSANSTTAKALSVFARFAAVVFIVGALCLVATLLHIVVVNMSIDDANFAEGHYWANVHQLNGWVVAGVAAALLVLGWFASRRFDLNVFGLNQFYRNRLVRCYLGATRWQPGRRNPHRFTAFDGDDEIDLADLRHNPAADLPFRGPFPILNGALNLGGSADLAVHTRRSASFVMTPLRCGADRPAVGYAPTRDGADRFAQGVTIGQAVSISGAAASPNMGYDTSPLVSFLLTMFNVRLAWWFPNPGRDHWKGDRLKSGIRYLVEETFGLATETSNFVNVSDGGHFENLGIYELVRRRCSVIIASDGECDDDLTFGSLGRVIRMCRTDFNAEIDIDVESIRRAQGSRTSRTHCAVGRITYANGSRGYLIYLKASLTGDEPVDVQQYHTSHPAFPHESTGDQFFAEDQFESYRKLGHHIASMVFRGTEDCAGVLAKATRLADIWVADSAASGTFVERTQAVVDIWERMRATPGLTALFHELHGLPPQPASVAARAPDDERVVCLELIQLLENTYLELRLDEHWTHPDNRGWVELFTMWARSRTFREVWRQYQDVYGTRFQYFCRQRLGLW